MWSGYVTDNTSLDVWGPGEGNLPDGKLSIEDLGELDNGYLIRPE